MQFFSNRRMKSAGVKCEEDGTYTSPRLQKYLTERISHGPAEREIRYLCARPAGAGKDSGWLVESFTELAQFQTTLGNEQEVETRQVIAQRQIASCTSYAELSRVFDREVRALRARGFVPERPHNLDVVILPPRSAAVQALTPVNQNTQRIPEPCALTGTNILPFTPCRR